MFAAGLLTWVRDLSQLLVIVLIYFSPAADTLLTGENIFNIGRQSIKLVKNVFAKHDLTFYVHTIVISNLLIFAVIANNYR